MTIQCPHCNSLNIETLDRGRTTGAVVGDVAGGAGAVAAAGAGARTGAIVGAAAGPFGSVIGTAIGGVLGAVAGAKVGSAAGGLVDDCFLDNCHCLHCDMTFCDDDIKVRKPASEELSDLADDDDLELDEVVEFAQSIQQQARALNTQDKKD